MICKKCGAVIPDGGISCANCGAPTTNPVYTVSPSKALTFGILGLAFSELGILGIIFSAIGLKLANCFMMERGSLFGQAKVGRILAKVGLIISIVWTVLWPFIIIGYIELVKTMIGMVTYY